MLIRTPPLWQIPESAATPEAVYYSRRAFLRQLGKGAAAATLGLSGLGNAAEVFAASRQPAATDAAAKNIFPAPRNAKYVLDRPVTEEHAVTHYNNFYEFGTDKQEVANMVSAFKTQPWSVAVTGLVAQPKTYDLDDLVRLLPIEERLYRHRCVEAWAMAVPWTGFPLKALIDLVQPLSNAKYVRMISFNKPAEAPGMRSQSWYAWPYYEGLRLDEAMNELAFLVLGLYGKPLPKQNGAPIRLALPWKYGYKSIKSIVQMEFTDKQPRTFWNDIAPLEYDFISNVNPKVPHPRWSQATEQLIPGGERRATLLYNGYAEYVAHLYKA